MCISIHPNTSHPSGRTPVRAELPFPYGNCFHWSNARRFNVRVRPSQQGHFDEDVAVRQTIRDEGELWSMVAEDRTNAEEANAPEESSGPAEPPRQDTPLPPTPTTAPEPDAQAETCWRQGEDLELVQDETLADDRGEVDGQSCASDEAISEFQAIVGMGVFGTRLDNKDDWPLVDVWLELADHLKQEDIPDPRDFYVECDTLIQLVRGAQQRLEEEEKAQEDNSPYPGAGAESGEVASDDPGKKEEPLHEKRRRRWWSPLQAMRKIRARTTRALARIKHALRLPCLSVWPKKMSAIRGLG